MTRSRRLSRRVILPLAVVALIGSLTMSGYARFAGPHSSPDEPFTWENGSIYLTGGSAPDPYTGCAVDPSAGERRWVEVPGGGEAIAVSPWFDGHATVTCQRPVMVSSGWHAALHPFVSSQPVIVLLAAIAVAAWWYGRRVSRP